MNFAAISAEGLTLELFEPGSMRSTAASPIYGETYVTKIGAAFDDAAEARAVAACTTLQTGIAPSQIRIIEPGDPAIDRKLEPEVGAIARTLAKAHLVCGAAGLVGGIAIGLVLILARAALFASSPWYTLFAFGFLGAVFGLLLGGLVSLRPDHDVLIAWVKTNARNHRWLVVVHARNSEETRKAREVLKAASDDVAWTL